MFAYYTRFVSFPASGTASLFAPQSLQLRTETGALFGRPSHYFYPQGTAFIQMRALPAIPYYVFLLQFHLMHYEYLHP